MAVAAQALDCHMQPPEQLADIHEDDLVLRAPPQHSCCWVATAWKSVATFVDWLFHSSGSVVGCAALRELYPGKRLPNNNQFPPGARILSFSNDDTGGDGAGTVTVGVRSNLWHICSKPATQITLLRDVWLWTVTLKKQPNV